MDFIYKHSLLGQNSIMFINLILKIIIKGIIYVGSNSNWIMASLHTLVEP